jgi:hypothetical protein
LEIFHYYTFLVFNFSLLMPTNGLLIYVKFRLEKAAYGMRCWQDAVKHFTSLLSEFSSNSEAVKELEKSKARLRESLTGEYDVSALFAARLKPGTLFDLADYVGPICVADVSGKG